MPESAEKQSRIATQQQRASGSASQQQERRTQQQKNEQGSLSAPQQQRDPNLAPQQQERRTQPKKNDQGSTSAPQQQRDSNVAHQQQVAPIPAPQQQPGPSRAPLQQQRRTHQPDCDHYAILLHCKEQLSLLMTLLQPLKLLPMQEIQSLQSQPSLSSTQTDWSRLTEVLDKRLQTVAKHCQDWVKREKRETIPQDLLARWYQPTKEARRIMTILKPWVNKLPPGRPESAEEARSQEESEARFTEKLEARLKGEVDEWTRKFLTQKMKKDLLQMDYDLNAPRIRSRIGTYASAGAMGKEDWIGIIDGSRNLGIISRQEARRIREPRNAADKQELLDSMQQRLDEYVRRCPGTAVMELVMVDQLRGLLADYAKAELPPSPNSA